MGIKPTPAKKGTMMCWINEHKHYVFNCPTCNAKSHPENDYVAWLRFTESGSILTCDSDAKGAFKVYREQALRDSFVNGLNECRRQYGEREESIIYNFLWWAKRLLNEENYGKPSDCGDHCRNTCEWCGLRRAIEAAEERAK